MTVAAPGPDDGPWLTIQEVAQRSGFSEPTLRYYERIGLIDPVPRDPSSRHRRYAPEMVERIEALACLRATGMGIDELRAYLAGVEVGRAAAPQMVALFSEHAARLEEEMRRMRVRHAYITAKAALCQSRVDNDPAREAAASAEALALARDLQEGAGHHE